MTTNQREKLLAQLLNLYTEYHGHVPPYDISTLDDEELSWECYNLEGQKEADEYRERVQKQEEEDRLFLENLPENYMFRELSTAESFMMSDGMPVYGDTYYSQLSESEKFWFDKIPLEEDELKPV